MRRRLALLAPLSIAALGGCGFALKQAPPLPFGAVALTGFAPRSPLAQALRAAIAPTTRVVDDPARAEVVLQALAERREKRVAAFTAAGQVRELQLRLTLGYRVHTPAGRELIAPTELALARDLSFNETAALAKAMEEAELYRDMESDVVAQLLRRLAALRP